MKRKIFVTEFGKFETTNYWVTAEVVSNLNTTPSSENVAWNGTATLCRTKDKFYLGYHNGNSNSNEGFVEISKTDFFSIKEMDDNGIEGREMREKVLGFFE